MVQGAIKIYYINSEITSIVFEVFPSPNIALRSVEFGKHSLVCLTICSVIVSVSLSQPSITVSVHSVFFLIGIQRKQ
jgi:hypothetical protein